MNILIIHNYYKIPGGEDTVVDNEGKLLKEHGHQVYFYKKNNNEMDNYTAVEKIILPLKIIFSLKAYKDVSEIIEEKKIDIVHVHNTVCVISPSVYYAAFKKKIPVVQTIHNFRLICPGAALCRNGQMCEECIGKSLFHSVKYSCYRGSKINTFAVAFMESFHKWIGTYRKLNYICLTEFNKRKLLTINGKNKNYIDRKRVFVKPNFSYFNTTPIPFSARKKEILYVGRLDPTKGIEVLFKSWEKIKSYDLVVCGIGPMEQWCQDYIREKNIDNIKLLGFVPNEAVKDIIANSIALILPTQWYEGFPMVLVEAFACGTPVLGSDIGNVNDIIQEGVNGWHFIHDDPADIARAVNSISDIVESTKKCADELYVVEANYHKLMDIYAACIRNNAGG